MSIVKAELMLYKGVCSADGCSEKEYFNPEQMQEVHLRAMQTIHKYLTLGWGVQFDDTHGLADSEKKAEELIAVLQKEFEGVSTLIRIKKCMDGLILFDRKAEFNCPESISSLVDKIKNLDYITKNSISPKRLELAFYSDKMP